MVEGCAQVAAPRASLCWGHLRRRCLHGSPGGPLQPRGRTPWRVLEDARQALQMAAEDDVERARKRYEQALLRWCRAQVEAALRSQADAVQVALGSRSYLRSPTGRAPSPLRKRRPR